jgi:hypothetical protein
MKCASLESSVFVSLRRVAKGSTTVKSVKVFQCALISKNVQKDIQRCAGGLNQKVNADSKKNVHTTTKGLILKRMLRFFRIK